jgi:hypothetical protein
LAHDTAIGTTVQPCVIAADQRGEQYHFPLYRFLKFRLSKYGGTIVTGADLAAFGSEAGPHAAHVGADK